MEKVQGFNFENDLVPLKILKATIIIQSTTNILLASHCIISTFLHLLLKVEAALALFMLTSTLCCDPVPYAAWIPRRINTLQM